MEKIDTRTRITHDELEKFRLNFLRFTNPRRSFECT